MRHSPGAGRGLTDGIQVRMFIFQHATHQYFAYCVDKQQIE